MKKIVAFPLVRLTVIVVPLFAVLAGMEIAAGKHHGQWTSALITAVAIGVLLLPIIGVERATTGRGPAAIGFDPKRILRDTAGGVALGAALFTAVALELALTGHYHVVAVHVTASLWVALGMSAALFGIAHASNPGATWLSSSAIAIEAGVLLGAAFAVTKNLWFPIGLHFAWNFCEGPIYGTQISGSTFSNSLVTAHLSGPVWLTGGSFGPEAGAPAVITCLVASLCLLKSGAASRKGEHGENYVRYE